MARGIRQAVVLLALATAVSLGAAGLWWWLGGGGLRQSFAVILMVLGGLLALVGGNALSRASTSDTHAFLGWGPDREDPDSGDGLTAIGVFLFVSLPLFAAGLALYGTG